SRNESSRPFLSEAECRGDSVATVSSAARQRSRSGRVASSRPRGAGGAVSGRNSPVAHPPGLASTGRASAADARGTSGLAAAPLIAFAEPAAAPGEPGLLGGPEGTTRSAAGTGVDGDVAEAPPATGVEVVAAEGPGPARSALLGPAIEVSDTFG